MRRLRLLEECVRWERAAALTVVVKWLQTESGGQWTLLVVIRTEAG